MKSNDVLLKALTVLFALILIIALAACAAQAKLVTGAERDAVLAYSEAKTDSLLTGLNNDDYAAFSRDFDDAMKGAITAANFPDLRQKVNGKIGNYVSRQIARVEQSGEFYAVIYTAKFEGDDPVTVRVVFRVTEPHAVSGLWFDSEKLRK
jgi:hypothetical protein